MTLKGCPREREVRELIARGQWPLTAETSPELHAHAAACRSCGDLVRVAEAFRAARSASISSARLVPPGVLWWRAQLRRRNAAMERVTHTLFGAQVFALAATLFAGLIFVVFQAGTSDAWRLGLLQLPQNAARDWNDLVASATANPAWTWMMIGPALALLGGVAVYLSLEKQ